MRHLAPAVLALTIAVPIAAQSAPERPPANTNQSKTEKDAKDPRQAKARELLESAGGQAAALPMDVQPLALLQLAVIETAVDKAKAAEDFDLAFAAAATLPSNPDRRYREDFQADIVRELAKFDPEHAMDMLRTMPPGPPDEPDSRITAVDAVLERALAEKRWTARWS